MKGEEFIDLFERLWTLDIHNAPFKLLGQRVGLGAKHILGHGVDLSVLFLLGLFLYHSHRMGGVGEWGWGWERGEKVSE